MDDQRIFLAKTHSYQLQAAFERCWNAERAHDHLPTVPLGIPALICAALAAEVGIKAILFAHGIEPKREHNLRHLLGLLPAQIRAAIIEEVAAAYPDFDKHLSDAEVAFVRWRYFYESEEEINVNIVFVGALGAAIQRQIGLEPSLV